MLLSRRWRALVWGCAGAGILIGGSFALGLGLLRLRLASDATPAALGVQQVALQALLGTVAREALLPHVALTLFGWLVLARLAPRVDASWRTLAWSLLACALLVFPFIGAFTFAAWSPTRPTDVESTALLLSGAVALALWLGRRAFPALRPGSFAAGRMRSPGSPPKASEGSRIMSDADKTSVLRRISLVGLALAALTGLAPESAFFCTPA